MALLLLVVITSNNRTRGRCSSLRHSCPVICTPRAQRVDFTRHHIGTIIISEEILLFNVVLSLQSIIIYILRAKKLLPSNIT